MQHIRTARVSRTTKAATAAAATPVVEPVIEPVVETVEDEVVALDEVVGQKAEPKPRKAAPIMSASRIRKCLDKHGVNKAIEDEIKRLAPLVHDFKKDKFITSGKVQFARKGAEAPPAPTAQEIEEAHKRLGARTQEEKNADIETELLVAEKVRFSKDAAVALGYILDKIVILIAEKILALSQDQKTKRIDRRILHDARLLEVPAFSVLTSLPSYVAQEKEELELKIKAAQAATFAETAALFKTLLKGCSSDVKAKLKGVNMPPHIAKDISAAFDQTKQKIAPVVAEPQEAAVEATTPEPANNKSFDFYVTAIFRNVFGGAAKGGRVSTDVKRYIGALLSEFVGRVAQCLDMQVQSGQIKTVSKDAVVDVVRLLVTGSSSLAAVSSTISVKQQDVIDADALAEERKKRADAKKEGNKYEIDMDSLPRVGQLTAVKVADYKSCGWDVLSAYLNSKC